MPGEREFVICTQAFVPAPSRPRWLILPESDEEPEVPAAPAMKTRSSSRAPTMSTPTPSDSAPTAPKGTPTSSPTDPKVERDRDALRKREEELRAQDLKIAQATFKEAVRAGPSAATPRKARTRFSDVPSSASTAHQGSTDPEARSKSSHAASSPSRAAPSPTPPSKKRSGES